MGHGQPRVIIWTTLVVLLYTMLHTKFQGHWSIGSGEEGFLRFLPYMLFPKGLGGCIWNLVAIGPVVSEEKSFEIVDGRRTDGRRMTDNGACLYYKLPRSLRLRWAKNNNEQSVYRISTSQRSRYRIIKRWISSYSYSIKYLLWVLLELYDKNLYEEIRKYILEKSTKLFVETHFCRNCLRKVIQGSGCPSVHSSIHQHFWSP